MLSMQPIPDYMRWLTTEGELHYLPIEKQQQLKTEPVNNTPGAYIPSKILDLIFRAFCHGVNNILQSIAFLCWCTEDDGQKFLDESIKKLDTSFEDAKERESIGVNMICIKLRTRLL